MAIALLPKNHTYCGPRAYLSALFTEIPRFLDDAEGRISVPSRIERPKYTLAPTDASGGERGCGFATEVFLAGAKNSPVGQMPTEKGRFSSSGVGGLERREGGESPLSRRKGNPKRPVVFGCRWRQEGACTAANQRPAPVRPWWISPVRPGEARAVTEPRGKFIGNLVLL